MVERPDAGLIGPGFVDAEGRPDLSTFRTVHPVSELVRAAGAGPVSRLLRRFDTPLPPAAEPMEPEWLGFACVLVRREVIDDVGLLDDGYFMYFEDIDYCRRVRAAGWTILYWPEARVMHLLGGSSQVTSEDRRRRRAPRYYYEARARYFAKFHGLSGLWLANALFSAGHCVSRARGWIGDRSSRHRDGELVDVWTNALRPFRPTTARPKGLAS